MLTKRELKDIFDERGFAPLKRFGENYLIDANIKDKIIEAAGLSKGDVILEIGPGLGALTLDLAASGADVYAVERDEKAFEILRDIIGKTSKNLKILRQDILDFDFKKIRSSKKIKVIGNLPYYITTPILEYLLRNLSRIRFILITVQREVANRLLAQPGSKDYSSLTCFIRYYTEPLYVHTIKRTCFYPEPEVDSSLVMLKVLDKPSVKVADEELFFKIVRGAFNQRRKSIINSLSRQAVLDMAKERLSAVLKEIGIDPSIRPESLSLSDFASISTAVNPLSR